MIHRALDVPVDQHDDGSREGMHDLDIVHAGRSRAAVEVTAAADGDSIALWKLMNGGHGRWTVDELRGGWMVTVSPAARAKRLRKELPVLLAEMENMNVPELRLGWKRDGLLDGIADDLGVTDAFRGDTSFPGSIYITLELPAERSGGVVAETGCALAEWIGDFLRDPDQHDVLEKLARSGASERHAFVFLPGFTTAPFPVSDLLMRTGAPLPIEQPELPPEVTHVWIVSTWSSGVGFRWSPETGWLAFDKGPEASDEPVMEQH